MKIKINNKLEINNKKKPLIIAEISGNHGGKKSLFLKHILSAHKNGADLVKIQTYEAPDITINNKKKKFKVKKGIWKNKYLWDLYSEASTPFKWHEDAFKLAKKYKINLFSTPFSERAVKFLEKFKVPLYKISSFEITDHKLVRSVAKTKKPIIISTGMASLNEVKNCVELIKKYHNKIVILHCVSGYPTPIEESNLNRIRKIKKELNTNLVGLSDHTVGINTAIASIFYDVVLIEKHFIINKKIKSYDKKFSIDASELKKLKKEIDKNYELKGNENFELKNSEKNMIKLRRSIYSIKKILKGEKFTKYNISTFRPKVGICASKFFDILGKKSKYEIKKFSPILKKHFH